METPPKFPQATFWIFMLTFKDQFFLRHPNCFTSSKPSFGICWRPHCQTHRSLLLSSPLTHPPHHYPPHSPHPTPPPPPRPQWFPFHVSVGVGHHWYWKALTACPVISQVISWWVPTSLASAYQQGEFLSQQAMGHLSLFLHEQCNWAQSHKMEIKPQRPTEMPISLGGLDYYSQVRSDSAAKRALAPSLMGKKSLSLNFFHFGIAGTMGLSYQGIKEKIEPGSSMSSQSSKRAVSHQSMARQWKRYCSMTFRRNTIPSALPVSPSSSEN